MEIEPGKHRLFITLVGIVLLAILLFLLIPLSYGIALPFVYWIHQFLLFSFLIALTFINTKWLAPAYLFQRKFIQYYLILFLACIVIIVVLRQAETWLNIPEAFAKMAGEKVEREKHGSRGVFVSFYIFLVEIVVLGVNIANILVKKWEEEKSIRLRTEKDKVEMELSFLKSQINPHFFFNSLNTVNALTYTDVEESRNALKKLAAIMRYVLYNTSDEKTTLSEEIEFIKNYVDLMKMRSPHRVHIDFSTQIHSPEKKIAPMLFLPFIENAFKHGISAQNESPISVSLRQENGHLVFKSKNKRFDKKMLDEFSQFEQPGIGIKNTRRRLELLYANRYQLIIDQETGFEVLLKIDLDED